MAYGMKAPQADLAVLRSRFLAWRPRLALLVAAVACVGAAESAWRWHEARRIVQSIETFRTGAERTVEALTEREPALLLARAIRYGAQGQHDEAAELFTYVDNRGASELRALARYDLGNLYLRQALAQTESGQMSRSATAAELAKEAYRQALRLEPDRWEAKFNLELAHRLAPEFEKVDSGSEPPDEQALRRLWATLPGQVRGLP